MFRFVWPFALLSGAETDSANHPWFLQRGEVSQRLWSLTCPYKYISNCAVVARTSAGKAAGNDSENTTNKPQVPSSDGKHALFILRSPGLQDSASDGVSTRNMADSKYGLWVECTLCARFAYRLFPKSFGFSGSVNDAPLLVYDRHWLSSLEIFIAFDKQVPGIFCPLEDLHICAVGGYKIVGQ